MTRLILGAICITHGEFTPIGHGEIGVIVTAMMTLTALMIGIKTLQSGTGSMGTVEDCWLCKRLRTFEDCWYFCCLCLLCVVVIGGTPVFCMYIQVERLWYRYGVGEQCGVVLGMTGLRSLCCIGNEFLGFSRLMFFGVCNPLLVILCHLKWLVSWFSISVSVTLCLLLSLSHTHILHIQITMPEFSS